VQCRGLGHLDAVSAVSGPASPPLPARGSCHQKSALAWGAVPIGWGEAIETPPGSEFGAGAQPLGYGGYENLGYQSVPQGHLSLDPCTMGQKAA
jgi:hypothetical protein